MVYSKVFESNCVSCHQGRKADGGVRYDTYENALRHGKLETLRESYEEHREPAKECSTISKPQMDLVVRWINDESQYDD